MLFVYLVVAFLATLLIGLQVLALTGAALLWLPVIFVGCYFILIVLWGITLCILSANAGETSATEAKSFYHFFVVETAKGVLFFSRTKIVTEGIEMLPEGPFLYVANHRSSFDPLVAVAAMAKRKVNFVSKPQNFKLPMVGGLMKKSGFHSIARDDDRAALKTILTVADMMKRGECSFGIYPEGRRNTEQEMIPFRNGCFKAAQRAQVPVVVGVVDHTENIHKNFPWKSTKIHFKICDVIPAEYVASHKTVETGNLAREIMERNLNL